MIVRFSNVQNVKFDKDEQTLLVCLYTASNFEISSLHKREFNRIKQLERDIYAIELGRDDEITLKFWSD